MQVEKILISEILPDPKNPRKTFAEDELKELAENIKAQGLLQPITVRPVACCGYAGIQTLLDTSNKYVIVCGERRYRACKMCGETSILAIVRELDDDEAFDAMITENLQRKDVDPIEEAYAFEQLNKKGSTVEDIAMRFGKSVRFVQDRIKLNSLIPELLVLVREDKMPLVSASIVSRLDEETQRKFHERNAQYGRTAKPVVESFLSDHFMRIDDSPWCKAGDEGFAGGCSRKCADCLLNTANEGCLFSDMNGGGKCTSRDKFRDKQLAWLMHFIANDPVPMVKRGEALESGKTVIFDNGCCYGAEDIRRTVFDAIRSNGYEIATRSDFGNECYCTDEEKLAQDWRDGKIYRTIDPFGGYGSIYPKVKFFYIRQALPSDMPAGAMLPVEVAKLMQQYNAAQQKERESKAAALGNIARNVEYGTDAVNDVEEFAIDCMMLSGMGKALREKYGLDPYMTPLAETVVKIAREHKADRPLWRRDWIRRMISIGFAFESLTWHVAEAVLNQWDADAVMEAYDKAEAATEKKQARIAEKLADLGYDKDGNKI